MHGLIPAEVIEQTALFYKSARTRPIRHREVEQAAVFWSSWVGVMHGRLPCVGRTDASMLSTGDPAGLGRLRRDRGPGVRPRSVSYSGRRAAMGGG